MTTSVSSTLLLTPKRKQNVGALFTNTPTPTMARTPQRTQLNATASTSTPSGGLASPSKSRLLYRGAISVPDSLILLDGVTFSAHGSVLENPLALALESMRGVRSLRCKGIVKTKDVSFDDSGGVIMDIHPISFLTQIYFENVFCLAPVSRETSTSENAVKIALGDTDGLDTTEILIFAQLSPSSDHELTMRVARLMPKSHKSSSQVRLPRPDDPTPRRPPRMYKTNATSLSALKRSAGTKRKVEDISDKDEVLRHAKEVMLFGKSKTVSSQDLSLSGANKKSGTDRKPAVVMDDVFKMPEVPTSKSKTKTHQSQDDAMIVDTGPGKDDQSEFEVANKNQIKRTTISFLQSAGVPKDHTEYKDLYQFVYRGSAFALRAQIKKRNLEKWKIVKAVEEHVKLYVDGFTK